jgi:hypothetical protein
MGFEVLEALKLSMVVSWVVTLCALVGGYRRFGGPYCLGFSELKVEVMNSSEALVPTY